MLINRQTIYWFAFAKALLLSHCVTGQEKKVDTLVAKQLEEVIITATRTKKKASDVALPILIINQKEIRNVNSIRLSDILEEQTGLITVPDFGSAEGIQIQGLDSQYVLILIDGVPLVGRSAGTFDINRISVGNIERIEVIKGASSSLYGNEALGGVINIITKKPKAGIAASLNHRSGSLNSHDTGVETAYKEGSLGLTFFVNRNSSDGYDLDETTPANTVNPFTNYTLSSNVEYELGEKTKFVLNARYYNQFQDESIINDEFVSENTLNEWNINFRTEYEFTKRWSAYLELYGSQYMTEDITRSDVTNDAITNDFDQRFLRPELRSVFKQNEKTEYVFGAGLTNERLERDLFATTPEFNAPYIYAQADFEPLKDLNIILGARYDAHNVYASQLSPKAALKYDITEWVAVKSSVGYGYKSPDFRQLFLNFTNAAAGGYTVLGYNELPDQLQLLFDQGLLSATTTQANVDQILSRFEDDLEAESSVNFNFGFDFKIGKKFSIGVNAFRNQVSNLIQTIAVTSKANGQNVFSYQNADEVVTEGLEVNATWKPVKNVRIGGGYQLLYAYDQAAKAEFEAGRVFARDAATQIDFAIDEDDYFGLFNRSRHTSNLKVFYEVPKWELNTNLRATYRSKYGISDSNNNGYLDSFDDFIDPQTVVDFAINKSFALKFIPELKQFTLGAGIDNLFDTTDPGNPILPGRLFYTNVNFQF